MASMDDRLFTSSSSLRKYMKRIFKWLLPRSTETFLAKDFSVDAGSGVACPRGNAVEAGDVFLRDPVMSSTITRRRSYEAYDKQIRSDESVRLSTSPLSVPTSVLLHS